MSADELRRAAALLRERAEAATPGPWSAADEHGLLPEAWPAWCVSQMRPGYQTMSETEGYVGDVAEVLCDRKDACPDATYIATMHPDIGRALAAVLAESAAVWDDIEDAPRPDSQLDQLARLARLILAGTS